MTRRSWFAVVCLVGLTAAGCCNKSKPKAFPTTIPIYPGATLKSSSNTIGIQSRMYTSKDEGKKVRDWYVAQTAASWTYNCVGRDKWIKRKEMMGMQFHVRCYKSKGKDGYLRVEVASRPGESSSIIRLRHCPQGRSRECAVK